MHDAASHPITAAIVVRIVRELSRMARRLGRPYGGQPFKDILELAWELLGTIAGHLHEGRISARPPVRVRSADRFPAVAGGSVRLGVFPATGNPLHWGHLLCALESMAELELDQVVFLIQGTDSRKALAGSDTQAHRHALARQVVTMLEPLVAYSDLGWDNGLPGEVNLFRLLRLNPRTKIGAHYIVGADHHRLTDTAGRPDTLPRLEQNMVDPALGYDPAWHELSVAFAERGERGARVPTKLRVQFLPKTLDCSSTRVRGGDVALTPDRVCQYLQEHPGYAKAIGYQGQAAMAG